MPLYEFRCPSGHVMERIVKHGDNSTPTCMHVLDPTKSEDTTSMDNFCGLWTDRVMSAPASVFPNADGWRK